VIGIEPAVYVQARFNALYRHPHTMIARAKGKVLGFGDYA
jgi:hypothetical protein